MDFGQLYQEWILCLGYSFYVDGAVFTSQPNMTNLSATKTFQVSFQSSTGFTIYIYIPEQYTQSTSYTFYSPTVSISASNFNLQPNPADDLNYLRGRWDYYIPGMSTSLSNIASNTSTMASDIATLKSYLDGLEGYTDQIEPYLNQLVSYAQIRDSVDIPLYSRFAYINLLRYGSISDQYNYPYSNQIYGFFPTILTNNYSAPSYSSDYDIDIPVGETLYFIYTISYWANVFDFIDSTSTSISPNVVQIEGNNYYRSYIISYQNNTNSRLWVNVSMNRNVNRPVIPLYLGCHIPADIGELFNIDFENTYTRLLQSISNGINTLNGSYDTSQYDQYEQTMDGLNDSLRGRFNSSNTSFQNGINDLLNYHLNHP